MIKCLVANLILLAVIIALIALFVAVPALLVIVGGSLIFVFAVVWAIDTAVGCWKSKDEGP